ncbi:hypothetical protein PTKIN_Ptkin08bG0001900 [Pterospermum kingtungense]
MKQSGRNIQSRSLNRVLGDIDSLCAQPYEVFMEKERRKLHAHWLSLVNEDLPTSYANWRQMQLQKWEITKSLEKDIKEKLNPLLEDEEDEDIGKLQDQEENVGTNLAVQDVEEVDPEKLLENQKDTEAKDNVSERLLNLNNDNATVSQEVPVSSLENVWPADCMPHSYHESAAEHEYASISGSPLPHQANKDQQNKMIDMESDLHQENCGNVLLHRHSEDGSFTTYTNQD